MVKKLPTKSDIRSELEREMDRYLSKGGKVTSVPQGTSGRDPGKPPTHLTARLFGEPKLQRTFVPEVVAAIEARRNEQKLKRRQKKRRSRLPKPRRKIIYDDFGEPLRRVWEDD
jgi:hypothetical protein